MSLRPLGHRTPWQNIDFKDRGAKLKRVDTLSRDWQAEQDRRLLLDFKARVAANEEKRRVRVPRTASTIVQFRRALDHVPMFLRRQAD